MDIKLLLIKLIILLYCESVCRRINYRSDDLAETILVQLKNLNNNRLVSDSSRSVVEGLISTIEWILTQDQTEPLSYELLLTRIRMCSGDNNNIFEAFSDIESMRDLDQEDETEEKAFYSSVISMKREIEDFLRQQSIKDIFYKAYKDIVYSNKVKDHRQYISEFISSLEEFSGNWTSSQKDYVVNMASMSDLDSLKAILKEAQAEIIGEGGLKSGWQGLNRMLGSSGCFKRGEFVVVGGLTHCYKSGLVHDLFRQFCTLNTPIESSDNKKPTILYYSSEENSEKNLMRMYCLLKEHETREPVNLFNVNIDYAVEYISENLQKNGWYVDMIRVNPSIFSMHDLFSDIREYEAKNHEIYAVFFDYLALINKKGNSAGMIGEDVRLLIQNVRNFMTAKKITFITPHQLSQEAMVLKRMNVDNFVDQISRKNYWDNCKRLANEVDLELYVDIVKHDGSFFLTIKRGKHRLIQETPHKYHQIYLPFVPNMHIFDDLHDKDSTIYKLVDPNGDAMML